MTRPKTIADLSIGDDQPIVVGKSLIGECKDIRARIRRLEEARRAEDQMLEAAGYDYNGNEEFALMMQRVGRR